MDPVTIWMGVKTAFAAGGFIRRNWPLIIGAIGLIAAGAYIGWLKIDAAWLRADLRSANSKVTEQAGLRRAAEEDAAQQHSYLAHQIEVNRSNAVVTEELQRQIDARSQQAKDEKARADILDRSYSALIGRLNYVDGNAPLSDSQRAFVRELWCLEQRRDSPPSGCPAPL